MAILRSGLGGIRPQREISIENLHPDPLNPRLPKEYQGKPEPELIDALYKFFNLQEIAISMSENGYFDAEPLVVVPQSLLPQFVGKSYSELKDDTSYRDFLDAPSTHFIVVEGNRRLCSAKLLLNGSRKSIPQLTDIGIIDDLKKLPVIVYPERRDVIAYLGARHIIGTRKWDAYAKARYVASLREEHKISIEDIQKTVGDTSNSARKIYACYKLIERVEQEYENIITDDAKENFSFLILATGQGSVKEYLGIPKNWHEIDFDSSIVPSNKIQNLKQLYLWIFGDGKEKQRVINESRDITNYLSDILRNPNAVDYLIETNDLQGAYDRSGGEEKLVEKYLKRANQNLEKTLGLIHRHKSDIVKAEIKKLEETLGIAKGILDANV